MEAAMDTAIQKRTIDQCERIFEIVTRCKTFLEKEGIFQWTDHYPTLQIIQNAILSGYLYQLQSDKEIIGIINGQEPAVACPAE